MCHQFQSVSFSPPAYSDFGHTVAMIPARKSPYTEEHIACICETLYRAKDGNGLIKFFAYLAPEEYVTSESDSVLKARLFALFSSGAFSQVYGTLKSRMFNRPLHEELQDLWFKAHYAEVC